MKGITLFEDEKHPESWVRDARFEYWDFSAKAWKLAGDLLSDMPAHTHMFKEPVKSTRFRLLFSYGLVGNFRFGEVILH